MKTLPLALSLALIGCAATEPLFESSDLTAEGVFTSGIEGPAVDQNGNLYAVNFGEEGTIGIVNSDGPALFTRLPEGSIANGIRFDRESVIVQQ